MTFLRKPLHKYVAAAAVAFFFCAALLFGTRQAEAASVKKIYKVSDLKKISENPAGSYKLMKNIKLTGTWTPIGTTEKPFTGVFDGNGYTISGLKTDASKDWQGLFGYGKGCTIKYLTVSGTVRGKTYVGGIAGQLVDSKITRCTNKAKIYGVNQVGGLIGRLSNSKASSCNNLGTVRATGRCSGGITSDLYPSGSSVYNSCNAARIYGGTDLNGGITGGSTSGIVANCVNLANVTGSGRCGAIAGDNANYAGSRAYNYFLKTSSINAKYSTIGTYSRTFNKSGKLSGAVTIEGKNYTKLISALNRWAKVNKYRTWSGSGIKVSVKK